MEHKLLHRYAATWGALLLGCLLVSAFMALAGQVVQARAPGSADGSTLAPALRLAVGIPVLQDPANGTITRSQTITFDWAQASDAVSYTLKIDSFEYARQIATTRTVSLANGQHSWTVQGFDATGVGGGLASPLNLTVDSQAPPAPALLSPANGSFTANTRPTFTWAGVADSGPAGLDHYEVQVDIGTVIALPAGTISYTPGSDLAQADHTWTVRACDRAGNCGPYATARTLSVDAQAPNVPAALGPADGEVTGSRPTFTWSAVTDNGPAGLDHYDVKLDGGTPAPVPVGTTSYTSASNLAAGSHTWTVRACDHATNCSAYSTAWTLAVDTQAPPTPALVSPANGSFTANTRPSFTWSAVTDNGPAGLDHYELKLDASTPIAVPASATSYTPGSDLAPGSHTWTVRACDKTANCSGYTTARTLTVDIQAPRVPTPLLPADNAATNVIQPTFSWQDNGDPAPGSGVAGFNFKLNGVDHPTIVPTTSYRPAEPLAQGTHTWSVNANDAVGTSSAYSAERTLIVDTQAPNVAAPLSPGDGAVTNSLPTFSWQAADDGGLAGIAGYTVWVKMNASTSYTFTASGTSYIPTSSLVDGLGQWQVRAFDRAGNAGAYSLARSLGIDGQAPGAPILQTPADNTTVSNTLPSFTWSAVSDPGLAGLDHYDLKIGVQTFPVVPPVTAYMPIFLADGVYAWTVRACDRAGNCGPYPTARILTVDTQAPPTPALLGPADGTFTTNTRPAFTWAGVADTGPAGLDHYNVMIDATGVAVLPAGTTSYTPASILAQANHTWTVRACDRAGNCSLYAASWTVTVDTQVPPMPTLASPPTGHFTSTLRPKLAWAAVSDSGPAGLDRYEVKIDANAAVPVPAGTTNYTLGSDLAQTSHTWTLRACDKAGNCSAFSTAWTLTINTQAPAVPALQTPADNTTVSNSPPNFAWSAVSDPGLAGMDHYELKIGVQTFSVVYPQTTYVPGALADGVFAWTVRACDRAGNCGAYSTARTLTVDTQAPPTPALVSPPTGHFTSTVRPRLTWSGVTDNGPAGLDHYEAKIDANAAVPVTAGTTSYLPSNNLAQASHTWTVRACDKAGNCGPYPAASTLIVDTQAPPTPALASPPTGHFTSTLRPKLAWSGVTDNGPAGLNRYEVTIDAGSPASVPAGTTSYTSGVDLAQTSHTWSVRACDEAGNCGTYSTTRSLTVDAQAPAAPQLVAPADNLLTPDNLPAFSWLASTDTGLAGLQGYTLLIDAQTFYTITAPATNYTLTQPLADGPHTWTLRSFDRAANFSAYTSARTLLIDHYPLSVAITLARQTANTSFSVSWGATDAGSGVRGYDVAYKEGSGPYQPVFTNTLLTHYVLTGAIKGKTYTFKVTAYSYQNNQSTTTADILVDTFHMRLPLVRPGPAPLPVCSVTLQGRPATVQAASINLAISGSVANDTLAQMRFSNDGRIWSAWESFAPTRNAWSLADGLAALRYVFVQCQGRRLGVSAPTYTWVYLEQNGDFEAGWNNWEHAGELNQTLVTGGSQHTGSYASLLGDPAYNNLGGVPVGSARTGHTFVVPAAGSPKLTVWYRILTHDRIWSNSAQKYGDTFDVFLYPYGTTPDWAAAAAASLADTTRYNRCRANPGVPDTHATGLVLCDGQAGNASQQGPAVDLGWKRAELDLTPYRGQAITLYFASFNRIDGWYNTWTFLDDLILNP